MAKNKRRPSASSTGLLGRGVCASALVVAVAFWAVADEPASPATWRVANHTDRGDTLPTVIPAPRDAGPQAKPTFSPTRPGEKAPRAEDTAFERAENLYLSLFAKSYSAMRVVDRIASSEVTRVYKTRHGEDRASDGPCAILKVQTLRGDRRSKRGTWREGDVHKHASDAGAPVPRFRAWRELERRKDSTTYALLTDHLDGYRTLDAGATGPYATHARGDEPGVADVAAALAELHAKGFAHGDLHHDNMLWRAATRTVAFIDLEDAQRVKRVDAGRSVLELCEADAADVEQKRGLKMFSRSASARCDDARELNLLLDAVHRDQTPYYDYDGAVRSKVRGDSLAARRAAWRAVLADAHAAGVAPRVRSPDA